MKLNRSVLNAIGMSVGGVARQFAYGRPIDRVVISNDRTTLYFDYDLGEDNECRVTFDTIDEDTVAVSAWTPNGRSRIVIVNPEDDADALDAVLDHLLAAVPATPGFTLVPATVPTEDIYEALLSLGKDPDEIEGIDWEHDLNLYRGQDVFTRDLFSVFVRPSERKDFLAQLGLTTKWYPFFVDRKPEGYQSSIFNTAFDWSQTFNTPEEAAVHAAASIAPDLGSQTPPTLVVSCLLGPGRARLILDALNKSIEAEDEQASSPC
jgi:hypothetical protein